MNGGPLFASAPLSSCKICSPNRSKSTMAADDATNRTKKSLVVEVLKAGDGDSSARPSSHSVRRSSRSPDETDVYRWRYQFGHRQAYRRIRYTNLISAAVAAFALLARPIDARHRQRSVAGQAAGSPALASVSIKRRRRRRRGTILINIDSMLIRKSEKERKRNDISPEVRLEFA